MAVPPRRPYGLLLWRLLRTPLIALLALLLMLSLLERILVFPAPPRNSSDWVAADLPHEDVYFEGDGGVRLHGWYVPHPTPRGVALYCHGNGEHVAHLASRLKILHQLRLNVFAWDYRSYGKSEGKPHEDNVIADALRAYRWLADRADVDPSEVILIGSSLGGAVAVQLAGEHPIRGLVIERSFAELTEAAAYHFPWLPVRWLMRNEFRSVDHIAKYRGPLLQVHGTADEIVPYEMGVRLFEAAATDNKRFITVEGGSHNEPLPESYYLQLDAFLQALEPAAELLPESPP